MGEVGAPGGRSGEPVAVKGLSQWRQYEYLSQLKLTDCLLAKREGGWLLATHRSIAHRKQDG